MIRRVTRRGRPAAGGGRLQSLGQDHHGGHLAYVASLPPGGQRWLRTKPFSAPPNEELGRCLRSFAHIVQALALPPGAAVLDVGCGPGWLSEFLARCGYAVTGVDVSPDMVAIARERVDAIGGQVADGIDAVAEFHAMPVTDLPWEDRFDAAVLYDAMHHFDDEAATLRAIHRALVPGGRIYIHEGVRPEPGSAGERELIEEMERYGTLEAPFDPEYLHSVLEETGFRDVRRLVEIDALVEVTQARSVARWMQKLAENPTTNTFIAVRPAGDAGAGHPFAAAIRPAGAPAADGSGDIVVPVEVVNTGRSPWPTHGTYPYPPGTVTVAPFVRDARGRRVELPRTALPAAVPPGGTAAVELRLPSSLLAGRTEVEVDMVREGMHWFADAGAPASPPIPLR